MPDRIDNENPNRYTCMDCSRSFVSSAPTVIEGDILCTLCLTIDGEDTWEEEDMDE